nr:uncharacterized protein LOC104113585 [Nicotiana tomentosiformis]
MKLRCIICDVSVHRLQMLPDGRQLQTTGPNQCSLIRWLETGEPLQHLQTFITFSGTTATTTFFGPSFVITRWGSEGARFAEVAGGTTAEYAAVCCCCPCRLVNLLVLTGYNLLAVLCRKYLSRLMKKWLLVRYEERSLLVYIFGGHLGTTT